MNQEIIGSKVIIKTVFGDTHSGVVCALDTKKNTSIKKDNIFIKIYRKISPNRRKNINRMNYRKVKLIQEDEKKI